MVSEPRRKKQCRTSLKGDQYLEVEVEKAVWAFAADQSPHFETNVVSPFTLIGPILHKIFTTKNLPGWINQLWNGQIDVVKLFPACRSQIQILTCMPAYADN